MKKLLALLLMSAMLVSTAACGDVVVNNNGDKKEESEAEKDNGTTDAETTPSVGEPETTPSVGEPETTPSVGEPETTPSVGEPETDEPETEEPETEEPDTDEPIVDEPSVDEPTEDEPSAENVIANLPKVVDNGGEALKNLLAEVNTDIKITSFEITEDYLDGAFNNDKLEFEIQNNSSHTLSDVNINLVGVKANGDLISPVPEVTVGNYPTCYKVHIIEDGFSLAPGAQKKLDFAINTSMFEELIIYVEGATLSDGTSFTYDFVKEANYILHCVQYDAISGESLDSLFADNDEINKINDIENSDSFPVSIIDRTVFYKTNAIDGFGLMSLTVENNTNEILTNFEVYIMRYDSKKGWREPNSFISISSGRPSAVSYYMPDGSTVTEIAPGESSTLTLEIYYDEMDTYKAIVKSYTAGGELYENETAEAWKDFIILGA